MFLKQPYHSRSNTSHRFPSFSSRCTLRYILTTHTSIIDITLDWVNFLEFYELISSEKLKTYSLKHYSDLTHFFIFWSSYKKHKFVLLVRPKWTPLNAWKL